MGSNPAGSSENEKKNNFANEIVPNAFGTFEALIKTRNIQSIHCTNIQIRDNVRLITDDVIYTFKCVFSNGRPYTLHSDSDSDSDFVATNSPKYENGQYKIYTSLVSIQIASAQYSSTSLYGPAYPLHCCKSRTEWPTTIQIDKYDAMNRCVMFRFFFSFSHSFCCYLLTVLLSLKWKRICSLCHDHDQAHSDNIVATGINKTHFSVKCNRWC